MHCPKCKAEFSNPEIISKTDKTNQYGRREVTYLVDSIAYIVFQDGLFKCLKCGHEFTMEEGVAQ